MNANEYQTLSERTMNFGPYKLSQFEIKLLNCVLGVVGESGELADLVKKTIFHGHPENDEKIMSEIGDVVWYLSALCSLLNINFDNVLRANVEKLRKRYPDGFSQKASIGRDG